MCRRLAAILLLAAVAVPVAAEPTRLTLSPEAFPKQSMKYRLLPDSHDLEPGNAATLYYRTLAMFFENRNLLEDLHQDQWSKWLGGPLDDLKKNDVGGKLAQYNQFLREAALAARCRSCDWQTSNRPEGIGLLLPDVQGYRNLANVLAVRARYDIANNRPTEAVPTLQSGFALAHNLGEGSFVIRIFVGAAVANMMCARVEELVQQPDAPNLYWALAAMPRPFFDPRHAVREEAEVFEQSFPWLKKMEEGPMAVEQVQACMFKLRHFTQDFGIRTPPNIATATLINAKHGDAKRYLIDRGFAEASVEAMPATQAVTLAAFRQYRDASAEVGKWALIRNGFRTKGYKEATAKQKEAAGQLDQLFFGGLLRGLQAGELGLEKLYAATGRVDRRLAALGCVESIRQHAAAHDGKLPKSLADLTDAPAPDDPVTGKPFVYKLDGETASLQSPAGADDSPGAAPEVDYELTVRH
jgi:hypothetical protein